MGLRQAITRVCVYVVFVVVIIIIIVVVVYIIIIVVVHCAPKYTCNTRVQSTCTTYTVHCTRTRV